MKRVLKYTILFIFVIAAVFPFFWLFSTSFKGAEEIFSFPPKFIPANPVLENYSGVWNAVPFGQYLVNSILIVLSFSSAYRADSLASGICFGKI